VPNEWYVSYGGWVRGIMDFNPSNSDNTNRLFLVDPQYAKLAPYTQTPDIYKCPADRSTVSMSGRAQPRVRSVSMNHAQGTRPGGGSVTASFLTHPPYQVYAKLSEIIDPAPDMLWVLVDEHPDSINNGGMAVQCVGRGPAARIIDYPASFHNGACGFSFADGHSEIKRWVDPRTTPPVRYNNQLELNVPSPNNPDVTWMQERTSALMPGQVVATP
jgi:prepilin-type processing-associated H-X9-DG protein